MSIRRIGILMIALAALLAMSVGLVGAQVVPAYGEWTGEVNAADASQLVVSGVQFAATDVQVETGLSLEPGTVVQVKFTAAVGSLNAVWVERLEAGDDDLPGTGEITGTIETVTTDSVSISGVPFNVVGALIDDDATLNAGSLVELHFTFDGTTFVVSRIEAEDGEDDAKAIGVIEAMDATTITVGGVVFDITSAQIDEDGVLAVGVVVEVEFTVAADGRVIALDIEFVDDDLFDDNDIDDDGDDDLDFTGTVEAMSGSTITVNGQVFDISQAVLDDEGTLAVGVVVDIDYVVTTDGRNVALEVEIEGDSDSSDDSDDDNISADFVLSGTIEAIDGTSLTINGVTVDINSADIDVDGTLNVGDAVTIYFQRDASGALTAIEVDEIDDIDDPFDDDRDDDADNDDDRDDLDDDNDSDDDDDSDDSDDVTVIDGCVRPDGWQTYRIGRGDTLSRIAGAANTTVDALVAANCLTSANFITVGQALFVPIRVNRLDDDNDDRGGDNDNDDDDDDDDDDNGGDDDNGNDNDDDNGNDNDDDDNDDDDNGDDNGNDNDDDDDDDKGGGGDDDGSDDD